MRDKLLVWLEYQRRSILLDSTSASHVFEELNGSNMELKCKGVVIIILKLVDVEAIDRSLKSLTMLQWKNQMESLPTTKSRTKL